MFHEKKTLLKSYAHVLFRIKGILNHHSAAGVEVPRYKHFNRVSNLNKLQSKTKLICDTIDLLNKKVYHSDP